MSQHITILCSTYGRPRQCEEMLSCFLKQTHPDRELIILNDKHNQTLSFSHELVTVINAADRFRTLGLKLNQLLNLAPNHGLVQYWDDDDIYLPDHLTYSLEHHARFKTPVSKHMAQWYDGGHKLYRIGTAAWMNTVLAERDILLALGGFSQVHNNSCVSIMHRLLQAGHINGPQRFDDRMPTFIYRQDDGRHHVSTEEPTAAHQSMEQHADPAHGVVDLLPHWREDYLAKATASWAALP